ncbi:MAG: element excision factor XisH family protein [Bacteroidota bacterium]
MLHHAKKDRYHDSVVKALIKAGWKITHDPYFLRLGRRKGFIDLGAEKVIIGAEKGVEKIAVEIKSFLGDSDVDQFEDAIGQFLVYRPALSKKDPKRVLFLAMPVDFYERLFEDEYFKELADLYDLKIIVFNSNDNSIVSWKK